MAMDNVFCLCIRQHATYKIGGGGGGGGGGQAFIIPYIVARVLGLCIQDTLSSRAALGLPAA